MRKPLLSTREDSAASRKTQDVLLATQTPGFNRHFRNRGFCRAKQAKRISLTYPLHERFRALPYRTFARRASPSCRGDHRSPHHPQRSSTIAPFASHQPPAIRRGDHRSPAPRTHSDRSATPSTLYDHTGDTPRSPSAPRDFLTTRIPKTHFFGRNGGGIFARNFGNV